MTSRQEHFTPFKQTIEETALPTALLSPFEARLHPLCMIAAKDLQEYLQTQNDWNHNFGLVAGKEGRIIGKMFGVLVVKTAREEIGYLAAFSGKLAGSNHHKAFVPPVFDSLEEGGFLNIGMEELGSINKEIRSLAALKEEGYKEKIENLKRKRKRHSNALQEQLCASYNFLNEAKESKNLQTIFTNFARKKPPAGAGECAAPKLLQYAFLHSMKPLALAEFWWGQSPKSEHWKHGHFYPICDEKCKPILSYMLSL